MLTYNDLKAEFKLSSDGDEWGNVMQWWFTVADEIYFNRDTIEVPESWEFRPSPLGPSNEPDDYPTYIVADAKADDLLRFGKLMDRYAGALRHADHDY